MTKTLNLTLGFAAILYGLVVLWFTSTHQLLPMGCLIGNDDGIQRGLQIRTIPEDWQPKGEEPEVGDHVLSVAGTPIRSYIDWAKVHYQLRHQEVDSGGLIQFGVDPTEANDEHTQVVEFPDKSRYVRVWFLRPESGKTVSTWIKLVPEPALGISLSLSWFVPQLLIVIVSGLAHYHRPHDQPLAVFFTLSSLSLMAFLGGAHWWVIGCHPFLVVIFATSAVLLPATLLHFFLVYPAPVSWIRERQTLAISLVYGPAICAALTLATFISMGWWLSVGDTNGPFAQTLGRLSGEMAASMMNPLRMVIFISLGLAVLYFLGGLAVMGSNLKAARNHIEASQLRSIFGAASFATIPVMYTIYLAAFDHVHFALGAAQIPMYIASLAFMLAYGIGVAKYKLFLIDQVVSRGVWYYATSVGLSLVFASLIAVGAVNVLHRDLSLFGHTLPMVLVLITSVLMLSWLRDSFQRFLDQRFFSEKYQLDKALKRLNRVVSSVLEPEAVSESLLNSCREVLRVEQAALYLRVPNRMEFRLSNSVGHGRFPLQIQVSQEAFAALGDETLLQRVPQGQSPAQLLIRELHAEVLHGLEIQGQLAGILVLGAKPHHVTYTAEDVAFVVAMARVTAVALHCATVQQDASRLNHDLQIKLERIADQDRQLLTLQAELAELTQHSQPRKQNKDFQRDIIKGSSEAIMAVLETAKKIAPSNSSVLIQGESGTGKELLAKVLHENSPRRERPMVVVHCAALSPTLLESELFGHVKGAFTDAREDKVGRFEMADGGTIFLDEIGDVSLDVQVKLLRVIQERTFEPVGSTKTRKVDVRIIAATHRDLSKMIAEGTFREDLFYRLNVINLTLPPLRDRSDDLFDLAQYFMRQAAAKAEKRILRFDPDALRAMSTYAWPGNVRELHNVVERAVVLAERDSIQLEDLPPHVRDSESSLKRPRSGAHAAQLTVARKTVIDDVDEETELQQALDACDGNKTQAARMLGMPRSTFFSKLKKYDLT